VTVPVWEKDGVEVGMPAGVAVGRVVDVPAKGGEYIGYGEQPSLACLLLPLLATA
jgi:hypothetical protein